MKIDFDTVMPLPEHYVHDIETQKARANHLLKACGGNIKRAREILNQRLARDMRDAADIVMYFSDHTDEFIQAGIDLTLFRSIYGKITEGRAVPIQDLVEFAERTNNAYDKLDKPFSSVTWETRLFRYKITGAVNNRTILDRLEGCES